MRSEIEVNEAIETYANMIRRICFIHLKNQADTEDVFQNVFLKYLLYEGEFSNTEHEKAWFIRVTINACKDYLRSLFRHKTTSLELIQEEATIKDEENREVLDAVLTLPSKYKDVIYLYYYEGYTTSEIAIIINRKENTVYSILSRGRAILKDKLGGGDFEE